ncbi:hypothetical protein [Clostridium magnum]|uniref:Uncharacterized protein n=1 Tax=Clostridium magnum DSM 2767 TaxID=1121326 RepID=A0A162RWS2_9CLOT|nr:hypothetical protein [Clostridium magnum]KZL90480.1 hypothetical protein CLMAG_42510 [Clostridium magnum DSM 2767]SHH86324.1 hypothetical protein SAMN02745944_01628 [Clostridium magnum DSM 2767]
MNAKYWLIYEPKFIPSRRITKSFNSMEGMDKWTKENKINITVIDRTKSIESQ